MNNFLFTLSFLFGLSVMFSSCNKLDAVSEKNMDGAIDDNSAVVPEDGYAKAIIGMWRIDQVPNAPRTAQIYIFYEFRDDGTYVSYENQNDLDSWIPSSPTKYTIEGNQLTLGEFTTHMQFTNTEMVVYSLNGSITKLKRVSKISPELLIGRWNVYGHSTRFYYNGMPQETTQTDIRYITYFDDGTCLEERRENNKTTLYTNSYKCIDKFGVISETSKHQEWTTTYLYCVDTFTEDAFLAHTYDLYEPPVSGYSAPIYYYYDTREYIRANDENQKVRDITLDKILLPLVPGDDVTLSVTVLPDNATDKSVSWSSSNNTIASVDNSGKVTAKAMGNATITVIANDGSGVFASCTVIVKGPCPAGAVDLGLSVYWATTNIGAGKPEGYGDYFAWGETAPKEDYSPSTYKFGWSSSDPLFKYNANSLYGPVDNKTVLDPEDDVASVKLSGKWRIPTDAEWTELLEQCTWTWTSNYSESGVSGTIITAPNGNSIFLPAAGYQRGTYIAAGGGSYWSSSLHTFNWEYAWGYSFSHNNVSRDTFSRFNGHSVRPVTD